MSDSDNEDEVCVTGTVIFHVEVTVAVAGTVFVTVTVGVVVLVNISKNLSHVRHDITYVVVKYVCTPLSVVEVRKHAINMLVCRTRFRHQERIAISRESVPATLLDRTSSTPRLASLFGLILGKSGCCCGMGA